MSAPESSSRQIRHESKSDDDDDDDDDDDGDDDQDDEDDDNDLGPGEQNRTVSRQVSKKLSRSLMFEFTQESQAIICRPSICWDMKLEALVKQPEHCGILCIEDGKKEDILSFFFSQMKNKKNIFFSYESLLLLPRRNRGVYLQIPLCFLRPSRALL